MTLRGQATGSTNNLTHKNITPTFGRTIKLSKQYGTEAGVGGDVEYKKTALAVRSGSQEYDLNDLEGRMTIQQRQKMIEDKGRVEAKDLPDTQLELRRQQVEEYKNKYEFPEGYAELFNKSYDIFMMYRDKLNVEDLNVHKSNKDVGGLIKFMVNDIEMNELRVQKAVKKLQNTLGNKV